MKDLAARPRKIDGKMEILSVSTDHMLECTRSETVRVKVADHV